MKTLYLAIVALALSGVCFGWNCPAGQIRQQAPSGTPTTAPYYDVVEGIAFICVPTPTSVTPTGVTNTLSNTNTAANTNTNTASSASNSTSTASSNQTQSQKQKQSQSQVATGGNAASTSSAANNGNNSNNTTVEAPKIPVSSAIAPPVLPSAPCIKGYSGAAQGGVFGASFGAGKIDEGCDIRETARSFSGISKLAQCKLLVNEKQSKKAGITMEDCMGVLEVPQQPVPVTAVEPVSPPVVVVAVAPLVLETRTEIPTYVAPKPVKRKAVRHMRPDCQNVVQRVCK